MLPTGTATCNFLIVGGKYCPSITLYSLSGKVLARDSDQAAGLVLIYVGTKEGFPGGRAYEFRRMLLHPKEDGDGYLNDVFLTAKQIMHLVRVE